MVQPDPKRTVRSFLRTQAYYDRELYTILSRSAGDITKTIRSIAGDGIGAAVRREQLEQVRKAMFQEMQRIMEEAGYTVMAAQYAASAAAVGSTVAYDRVLFSSLGKTSPLIGDYQAARTVQSMFGIEQAKRRLLGASYFPLSDRVYGTLRVVTGQVDRYVESSLAQGLNARELAAGARRFILPSTPGGVSYAALRLGRTEINNSFHAIAADRMQRAPWVTASQWHLSRSHPTPDLCDKYAEDDDDGLGPGLYLPENIPQKPHPQCFCFVTPHVVDDEEFNRQFDRGRYDDFLGHPNIDPATARVGLPAAARETVSAWLPSVLRKLEVAGAAVITTQMIQQAREDIILTATPSSQSATVAGDIVLLDRNTTGGHP